MRLSSLFQADKTAYSALVPVFAQVKEIRDEINVLTARQWGASDEDEIRELTDQMTQARLREYKILSDPQIALDLEAAQKNKNGLKKWEKKNLDDMAHAHAVVTSADGMDGVKARLSLFAAGEQGFARTMDEHGDNRRELWEAQKPLLKAAFITVWKEAQPVAQKFGMSPYEVAMMQYMPGKTDKDIKEYLTSVEREYPHIVKAMLQDTRSQQALPIPTFEELCEGQDRSEMEEKYRAFLDEIQQSFLGAAGWTAEELEKHSVKIETKIAAYGGYCWGSSKDITIAIGIGDEPCIINTAVKTASHESGHVLYNLELNRMPEEQRTQLVGQLNGMGIHETAALYFEEMAKSKKASEIIAALAHKHFGVEGSEWSAENIYNHSNPPANTPEAIIALIDTSSDLVAMPAAYAWRVKMEQDILNSKSEEEIEAKIENMPETWARFMEKITGLKDQYDAGEFAMDESHFFVGMMGYFPAYPESAKNVVALLEQHSLFKGIAFHRSTAQNYQDLIAPSYKLLRESIFEKASTLTTSALMKAAVNHVPSMRNLMSSIRASYSNEVDIRTIHPNFAPIMH